jgi:signal transduction histidine kinase
MSVDQTNTPRHPIFALTSESVVTIGEDFIIQETNPAFGHLMGWVQRSPVGFSCMEVLRCRDERNALLCGTPRCPASEAFSAQGATFTRELRWQARSGKSCEVTASLSAQREQDATRAVMFAHDVTLLNAANRMRANFISMVSHELRTPLHSINGFLDIVLDGQVGPLNPRQEEFLNYARTSAHQLTTLVEDILFISKADSGQFTLRLGDVRIPTLVAQVLHTLQSAAEKAEVSLIAEVSPTLPVLRADELRLQQVLSNLLNNAITFSPSGSCVTVRAAVDGDEVHFSVIDQGKGISPEDQARIFERFYQSESGARASAGGYGLGLSIAKLIVEQHNGRILVESQPDHGSEFHFTIPTVGGASGDAS